MAGPRILLLEDDPNLGAIILDSLEHEGYEVVLRADGEEGLSALAEARFDLCLADVMMPRLDGFAFAREVRRRGIELPLIFLTAKAMTEDTIEGFRLGCDDYVTKPFAMEELQLRIEAVLRRRWPDDSGEKIRRIGGYRLDIRKQLLLREGVERRLTGRECDLLTLLCDHQGRVLDRSEALLRLWGDDGYHKGRSMDVFISRLRKYLADDPSVEIRTVHGRGFKLLVD